MTTWRARMVAAAAVAQAGAAAAQAPCPAVPAPLPAALAGWSRVMPVAAGRRVEGAPALTVGTGARATLRSAASVSYAVRTQKPQDAASFGGLFTFDAPAAGRYRVALGSGAWIDVVRDGRALDAVAHDHGPECSGVRKMVDFDLIPGRYVLQVAGNGTAAVSLLVTRLP